MSIEAMLLAGFVLLHVPLVAHGLHRLWLQTWLLRPRPVAVPGPEATAARPRVTVQLPVFNERLVVERVVEAAGALDWPCEQLEIQVLDDSTDETTALAQAACAALRERGLDAKVMHRTDRTGFKAGALAAGTRVARGDFLAIFDADFVPEPDFLKRTVPWLVEGAGMVQVRWGHLNEGQGLLTFLQGILLDGHLLVEQPGRFRGGRWLQFNGTAGVWRKDTIALAGGWEHDTLTEDLDLSYRAQIAGARLVFLDDVVAPAELPAHMAAFKAQQHRWGKGMTQALRKTASRILVAPVDPLIKIEAMLHLSSALVWPVVALLSVTLPLLLWLRELDLLRVPGWLDQVLLISTTVCILSFFAVAAVRARRRRLGLRLLAIPLAMALASGLALAQTRAVMQGLTGPTGVFVRTPKAGDGAGVGYLARFDGMMVLELLMACWLLGAAGVGAAHGLLGAVPFLYLFGVGYALVGGLALFEAIDRWRHAANANTANAGDQVTHHSADVSAQVPSAGSQVDSTV